MTIKILLIRLLRKHFDRLTSATTVSNLPVRCFFHFLIAQDVKFSKNVLQLSFFRDTEQRGVASMIGTFFEDSVLKREQSSGPHRIDESTYICGVADREI